ncbi:MAG: MFS transporter [Pseudomonadota bacterium]
MTNSTQAISSKPSYLNSIFFGSFAFVFLNFSLPIRADDLGIDAVGIGGMYAVFTGTMLIIRPLVGYCLDRFGRRWFFTSAFVFYVAAMSVFAQSSTIYDFYLARFLQGIGASLMWVSARTIIADLNTRATVGAEMGRLTTTSVRGSMVGAMWGFTLLGFMPMQSAWVWAFAGYALASLLAFIWSFKVTNQLPEDFHHEEQLKIPWSFNLARAFVIVFLSAFASALIEPIYLIFLKDKFEVSVLVLAYVFLPSGIVYAILPRYSGQWSDRWGRGPVIAVGVALAGLVSMALPYWSSLILVALSYILFSVGWAMASPAHDALIADMAPARLRGTVLGAKEAAAGIGAAFGPLAGGYIYEYWAQEMAFVSNGVLLLLTACLALIWFGRNQHQEAT